MVGWGMTLWEGPACLLLALLLPPLSRVSNHGVFYVLRLFLFFPTVLEGLYTDLAFFFLPCFCSSQFPERPLLFDSYIAAAFRSFPAFGIRGGGFIPLLFDDTTMVFVFLACEGMHENVRGRLCSGFWGR